MYTKRFKLIAVLSVAACLTAAGCTAKNSADSADRKTTNDIQNGYATNQPIPVFSRSQQRQNLIEIETMQANVTPTWAYFFIEGKSDGRPVFSCPSIGDPIPASYQLSNPLKAAGEHDNSTIAQMEPTGVFTGNTDGTHVICLDAAGVPYKMYWEGRVLGTTVELEWNGTTLAPKAGSTSTAKFSGGK